MHHSKRARILRRVLDYINAGSWWCESHGILVFGERRRVETCISSVGPDDGISNDAVKEAQAIRSRIVTSRGKRTVARRVTVGQLPAEPTQAEIEAWLLSLPPKRRDEVLKYVGESLSVQRLDPATSTPTSREDDNLDASLAEDMLSQLESSFIKIRDYRALRVQHASPWVQRYFEEAHRCHIYGLEVACVVLCRGLLEAVLADLVDPTCSLRRNHPALSHLSAMIDAARGNLLTQQMADSADRIKEAGNTAIHDLRTFQTKFAPHLEQILDDTRKLVSALYK